MENFTRLSAVKLSSTTQRDKIRGLNTVGVSQRADDFNP